MVESIIREIIRDPASISIWTGRGCLRLGKFTLPQICRAIEIYISILSPATFPPL